MSTTVADVGDALALLEGLDADQLRDILADLDRRRRAVRVLLCAALRRRPAPAATAELGRIAGGPRLRVVRENGMEEVDGRPPPRHGHQVNE
jgi:hypothetical protein